MAGELNQGYVISKKGILKMVEILFTCVAFACMVVANKGFGGLYNLTTLKDEYNGRYDFFLAFHIIGFIVAIVIFVVHLLSVQESLGSAKIWNILNLVSCVLLLILCAVSGGLMIKYAKDEHESVAYEADLGQKWRWYTDHRIAAIAFSFFSAVAFLVDAIFQFPELRG